MGSCCTPGGASQMGIWCEPATPLINSTRSGKRTCGKGTCFSGIRVQTRPALCCLWQMVSTTDGSWGQCVRPLCPDSQQHGAVHTEKKRWQPHSGQPKYHHKPRCQNRPQDWILHCAGPKARQDPGQSFCFPLTFSGWLDDMWLIGTMVVATLMYSTWQWKLKPHA